MQNAKIGLISLGCPRNLVDSEAMCGILSKKGFKVCETIDNCDVAVINTCSFIEDAKRESIDAIFDVIALKKEGRIKAILVCGCLPQRYKEKLKSQLPEIDGFLGTGNFSDVALAVESLLRNKKFYNIKAPGFLYDFNTKEPLVKLTSPHFAYVKIAEGCAHRCSYCVIPRLRGRLRSRTVESIVEEINQLCSLSDIKEINLVAQDTTLYGLDRYGKPGLSDLIRAIADLNKVNWIRLLYAHPKHFTDELIGVIKDTEAVCKYVDLPLEHINDQILQKMNRQITKKEIVTLIGKLRKRISGLTVRTAFIVGFPGETEKQFEELLDFIKDIKFERLGAFAYSREEGTPAYCAKNQIPQKIKIARLNELMKTQQKIATQVNSRYLGGIMKVLVDEKDKNQDNLYLARTQGDAPEVDGIVYVTAKNAKAGDFLDVKITDTLEYDLVGEAL